MAKMKSDLSWLPNYVILAIFVTCALATNSVTPVYLSGNTNDNQEYHEVAKFQHFNEPFDERVFGKLNIDVLEVTPSSIHVRWRLTNLTYADSVMEFTFLCETFNGRIVSDKMHSNTDSFRFEFLNSNTKYVICIHLLEKSTSSNTSVLHYSCQPFSTIPVIRSDSMVGVALTLGYFLLMVVLGYLAWYRRARKFKSIEEEDQLKTESKESQKDDEISKFVKTGGRFGISNYSSDDDRRFEDGGVNGGAAYKSKDARRDCSSGACVPFSAPEEEELVEYDAKKREISF